MAGPSNPFHGPLLTLRRVSTVPSPPGPSHASCHKVICFGAIGPNWPIVPTCLAACEQTSWSAPADTNAGFFDALACTMTTVSRPARRPTSRKSQLSFRPSSHNTRSAPGKSADTFVSIQLKTDLSAQPPGSALALAPFSELQARRAGTWSYHVVQPERRGIEAGSAPQSRIKESTFGIDDFGSFWNDNE